ncbi:MAG: GNAT family N-acetyltransferase [Pelagibaca sp.]
MSRADPSNTTLLVRPAKQHLASYQEALRTGWSPNNLRPEAANEELAEIAADADLFLARMEDRDAKGAPVILPDGSFVPRLPSLRRWIWSDGFCGSIGLRWQPGTEDLPPTCLGHIGYAVVPKRRGEGLATAAVLEILPIARSIGLRHVDLTADPDNIASIRVMERAGAGYVGTFTPPEALGGVTDALYRILL